MSNTGRFFALIAILVLAASFTYGQGRDVPLEDIVVRGEERIPVHIASESSEVRRLAERAFATHGRFQVVRSQGDASFTFRFMPEANNRVRLRIESGGSQRVQLDEVIHGSSGRNALLRAADRAVRRTTGLPGYFAGRITFVGERTGFKEIYTGDLFFGEVLQVTNDRDKSVLPHWSPDGRMIYYTGYYRSGFPDLFRIDTQTRSRNPFITFRGTNTSARFSPDGRSIAMVLSGEGNPEIYLSNPEGRQIRRLTRTNSVQSSPTWSPDGRQVAFTSDRDGRPQIFRMRVDGGAMQRIPTNISGHCTEPDWNPVHANKIVFTAAVAGRFALALYDFDTRQSEFLTQGPADAIEPRWLNDGRHLIYTARTSTSMVLMLLDTETKKTTALHPRDWGKASQADFWIP